MTERIAGLFSCQFLFSTSSHDNQYTIIHVKLGRVEPEGRKTNHSCMAIIVHRDYYYGFTKLTERSLLGVCVCVGLTLVHIWGTLEQR